jgi:hypothetical protein
MPLPSEETTPPVTKMYLVMAGIAGWNSLFYPIERGGSILDKRATLCVQLKKSSLLSPNRVDLVVNTAKTRYSHLLIDF